MNIKTSGGWDQSDRGCMAAGVHASHVTAGEAEAQKLSDLLKVTQLINDKVSTYTLVF